MNGGQQDRRSHSSHIYTELPPPYTKPGKMKQRGTAPSFNLNTSELMEIQKAAARVSNVPSPEMTSFVIKTPCLRRSTINLIPGTYHQVLNDQQDEPRPPPFSRKGDLQNSWASNNSAQGNNYKRSMSHDNLPIAATRPQPPRRGSSNHSNPKVLSWKYSSRLCKDHLLLACQR
jgi:hypothetical protein